MAKRQVTAIRLGTREKQIALQMAIPARGQEGGISGLVRRLVLEEAARRGLVPGGQPKGDGAT